MSGTSEPTWVDARRAPYRRLASAAIIIVVLLAELALAASWVQLHRASTSRQEADSLSIAFTDVQRHFYNLELLAVTESRFDTPRVDTELALLERQLEIAARRLSLPSTSPQLAGNIEQVLAAHEDLVALQQFAPQDMAAAADLAARGQLESQHAVDRTATVTRAQFLAEIAQTERTATIVVVIAAIVLVSGIVLVWAVLRRYQRSFEEAWRLAATRREALRRTNEQLAALADERGRFVSELSHELRSPLAVLDAVGETLHHHYDRLDEGTRKEILESLRHQVDRQQRLVDNLLMVSREQNPDQRPDPQAVNLTDFTATMRRDHRLGGSRAIFISEGDPVALVDPHHLEQVLTNLVRNAEKYGGERIELEARVKGGNVMITVTDDGDGVPESLRETLFEPFTQAESASGGIGLGLAITRQLIEANGGSITYRHRVNGGAVFEVLLPRADLVSPPHRSTS